MIPIFVGSIKNSHLEVDNPEQFQGYLLGLEGKRVQLKLEKEKKRVTVPQHRYYRGVVVIEISKHTGYTPDEVHELMASMFLKKYMEAGGKRYTVIRSSADLTTVEMKEFVESCKQFAAIELGINILDSKEIYT
jgi:hypothetical protein